MEQLFSVKNKTVLVTGGTGGIGLMIAEGFAKAGANVVVVSRKQKACEEASEYLNQFEGKCVAIPADVSTEQGVVDLLAAFSEHYTGLDVMVNNAGATWGASFDDYPEEAWEKIMSLNVKGPFYMAQKFKPLLKAAATERSPSRIINITSIAGSQTGSLQAYAYGPSKAALNHLTRILANEMLDDGINVNAIAPGFFPSKMTAFMRQTPEMEAKLAEQVPMGRIGEIEDIAGLAIYLSSQASAYMTGNIMSLDGGMSARGINA